MKFAERLEEESDPRFKKCYIAYRELKDVLENRQSDAIDVKGTRRQVQALFGGNAIVHLSNSLEGRFAALLEREFKKINKFVEMQELSIKTQFPVLIKQLEKQPISQKILDEVEQALIRATADIKLLERFVVLNRLGFRKICKKYDKLHPDKTSGTSWFIAKVETQPFARINFDAMLSAIGMVYQKFRAAQSSTRVSRVPSGFSHSRDIVRIEKFWLADEESVWLKLLLTKHLDFQAPASVHPKEREQAVMHPVTGNSLFLTKIV